MISCICPVYGGIEWLNNAVACFLKQDWHEDHELVIVNSFPQQTLWASLPRVRIINLGYRPSSLGYARNICIEQAHGDFIVIWDSDDLFLPNHVRNFATRRRGKDWVWLTPQFWVMAEEIKDIVIGACPLFGFSKVAWAKAGGYPDLTVGEDSALISKISASYHGEKCELPPEEISFLYRWGQGSHHVSGMGLDAPGKISAHERARVALEERVRNGLEPTGTIQLRPNNPIDWKFKSLQFLATRGSSKKKSIAIVELGRYGDICNVLPIARHIAETYAKPHFVVAREFLALLEGCSYVIPHPVDLQYHQLHEALDIAKRTYEHVINAQIYGQNFEIIKTCASYNRESWRMAGFLHKFDDPTWRPVFDRRDPAREQALWHKLDNGKPAVLVNLTKSISSPFNKGQEILDTVRRALDSGFNIIDVSSLHLPFIFDLVGLIERARCVLSIDTALIHLAAATNTPVIALVNPQPWQGSELRCNCIARIPYNSVNSDNLIAFIKNAQVAERFLPAPLKTPPLRTIIHAVERHHEDNGREKARKEHAQASWNVLYSKGVKPGHFWNYPRNALSIGDIRPLPYLKDLLQFAMSQIGPEDIVMFSNDDNWLHPQLPKMVELHASIWGAVCSQRCEFRGLLPNHDRPPKEFAEQGELHIGRDVFAFTKRWLESNWSLIPDMILGASEWDWVMCTLIRLGFGIETTRRNIETNIWPADMERGYVAHQYHPPVWKSDKFINDSPANLHNRAMLRTLQARQLQYLPSAKGTVTVRRSAAFGDVLAATCVANKLLSMGVSVAFQALDVVHPMLRHCSPVLDIHGVNGGCDVNLDGAYENHPERAIKTFQELFIESANQQLVSKGIRLEPFQCTPKMRRLNHDHRFPKPVICICPRSNAHANRTVPDQTWAEAAKQMPGTKVWLGTHAPSPSPEILDARCHSIDDVVRYLSEADLYVGVDTGPMHIAAALGVPVIGVLQASSPAVHLTDQRDFQMVYADLDCLNCQKTVCPINPLHPPCCAIAPERIVDAVRLKTTCSDFVCAIIIVHQPPKERLKRCIEALKGQVKEIIVCGDQTSVIPTGEPGVRYIRMLRENTGYGRKLNYAVRHTVAQWILPVNDDVFLDPGAVARMLDVMRAQPRAGIVGNLLWYPGRTQVQHGGTCRNPGDAGWGHIDHKRGTPTITGITEMENVTGASCMIRREAFYDVLGMDERYFLYYEDNDFNLRLRRNQWKVFYTPFATGIHEEHGSTGWGESMMQHERKSRELFLATWQPYFNHNRNNQLGNFEFR